MYLEMIRVLSIISLLFSLAIGGSSVHAAATPLVTNTDIFSITSINNRNSPPNAVNDYGVGFETDQNTIFTTASVLANDSDPDNNLLTISSFNTTGIVGIVTYNGDGTFDYDPNGQFTQLGDGYTSTDSFTYTIDDGYGGYDNATVSIDVNGINDTPHATDDSGSGFNTDQDSSFSTSNVLVNDTDPDFDALFVESFDSTGILGLITDNGDGTFFFDPNNAYDNLDEGESKIETFTYTVSDGHGGSDTADVGITIYGINDHPNAVDDIGSGFSTFENAPFTTANVLTNDSDPEGGALNIFSIDTTGTLGLVGDNGDGTFDYDPNGQFGYLEPGAYSTDTFTYTLTDNHGDSDMATVTITIFGGNGPPYAVDDSGSGFETDQHTTFTTANVLTNDSDPEGDALNIFSIDTTGTLGLVGDNGDGTFDYDPNGSFDGLAYGYSAEDFFTYTVSDGNGGSDTGIVTITITNNDPLFITYMPFIFN